MGNIGIDVSREELAKQCTEGVKIIHEQRVKIEMYEKAFKLMVHWLRGGDEMSALAQEMLEGKKELLGQALNQVAEEDFFNRR